MKREKTTATLLIILFLTSILSITVMAAKSEMPPTGLHYDVNFVTGGKIAFESDFDGTTTPTVPPFYWHDDFEGGIGNWQQVGGSTGNINLVSTKGRYGSTAVEVYQTSDAGDTVLYASISAPGPGQGRVIFWFYDDISVTGTQVVDVLQDTTSLIYGGKALLIGILQGSPNYVYREFPGGWVATSIPRETGWHKIEFIADGSTVKGIIDEMPVASTTTFGSFNFIEIGSYWKVSGSGLYYDDVTVLGETVSGQEWIGDGPTYTEPRTMTGTVTPVSGGPIGGSMIIESSSTLNAVTGAGTSSGDFTFTDGTGGFSGTFEATNTNFGLLDGSFVSTESTGIYKDSIVEGTLNGHFYESYTGSGYDSFQATIVGTPAENEILVKYDGTVPGLAYVLGPIGSEFKILDNDAGVFDGDCAVIQIPEEMIFDVYCSARGKPGGSMYWGCDHERAEVPVGKPTWHQHSPDNFDLRNYGLTPGEFGPQLGPYPVTSDGCTILATRWYPQ